MLDVMLQALYPAHFGVFVRAAEDWSDSPEVTTSLIKFMMEFVYNKASIYLLFFVAEGRRNVGSCFFFFWAGTGGCMLVCEHNAGYCFFFGRGWVGCLLAVRIESG